MKKKKNVRLEVGLKKGAKGKNVGNLQDALVRLGYLADIIPNDVSLESNEINLKPYKKKYFDKATEEALKIFQKKNSLKDTGILDEDTVVAFTQKRCNFGLANNFSPFIGSLSIPAFSIDGERTLYTYSFEDFPIIRNNDLIQPHEMLRAVEQAFSVWSKEIPIGFRRVSNDGDIKITFKDFSCGFTCPACSALGATLDTLPQEGKSEIRFNLLEECDDFRWFYDSDVATNSIYYDFISTAIHEVGHAIGLIEHYGGVMRDGSAPIDLDRNLFPIDRDKIRALYGAVEIIHTTSINGNMVQPQSIDLLREVKRFGNKTSIISDPSRHWFHLAIPTINVLSGSDQYLNSVSIKLKTYINVPVGNDNITANKTKIEKIDIWDGEILLSAQRIDIESEFGTNGIQTHDIVIGIASKPKIQMGISISILIRFYRFSKIDFISASCNYTKQPKRFTGSLVAP